MKNQVQTSIFAEMPLSPKTIHAIEDIGYTQATDIQSQAIPLLIEGRDLIGRSRTGTGKTAAFGIPAIESVNNKYKHAQVLVLAPTRELAMQIATEMKKYAKYHEGISVATVYGGAPMNDQIKQLRRANIVIGTPGRLLDHIRRKTLKLNQIQTVILDEADEMLNMGFIEDIETILTQVPTKRQTVLFSATMSEPLLKISNTFLTNPYTVNAGTEDETKATIEQTFYQIEHKQKKSVLTLLMHANKQRSIVFCNTKLMVDELAELLRSQGFKASGLHGDMTQAARSQVMQEFRNGSIHSLIATDVAARGIDVDDVDVVINYDLPQTFEYYIHRIGRTGRAGKEGLSQTLICNKKQYMTLRSLMKYTGSTIQERKLPSSEKIMNKAVSRLAEDIETRSKKRSGKAARKLVQELLASDTFQGSEEQVATALAEMLIGGDAQFDRLKDIKTSTKKTSHSSPRNKKSNQVRGQRRRKDSRQESGKNAGRPKNSQRKKFSGRKKKVQSTTA
ncbi:MAG: DEAD/DEAH box helicase [Raoultibacter sp.]